LAVETRRVDGFLPSTHGFHFPNDFPSQPLFEIPLGTTGIPIGNASDGLCGGMTYAARDLFEGGLLPPTATEPPSRGTPLFSYLVRRAIDSFDLPSGPLRYMAWMSLPTEDFPFGLKGLAWRTSLQEWPRVKTDLDAGRLSSLGLIRARSFNPLDLGRNHQVLAYGYDLDATGGTVRLPVYDPNHPRDDSIAMTMALGRTAGPVAYIEGEDAVRGFFRTSPRPADRSKLAAFGVAPET
jgi:hypothetical protein